MAFLKTNIQESYNTPRYRTPQAISLLYEILWKDSLYSLLVKV